MLLATPTAALAAPIVEPDPDDIVIFGSNYTLLAGESIEGSLVVFGGNATVEAGATVNGDVFVVGGNVNLNGTVMDNVVVIGGNLDLGPTAVVNGDLVNPGGNITRDPSAQVLGSQVDEVGLGDFREYRRHWGDMWVGRVWSVFQTLAVTAVALLLALFIPGHIRRTADTIAARPAASGGLGLLTLVATPFVLLITLITCVLPAFIFVLVVAACLYGWVALGYELGRRFTVAMKLSWSPVVETTAGTFGLSILAGLLGLIPCIGWLGGLALGSIGLGATVLSRFGTLEEPLALPAPEVRKPARKKATKRTK